MAQVPDTARVVVIGGGAVGVSVLYHLGMMGWHDCVLLEKNELTAGSTWHAAGNCPNFSANWAVMNLQRYSLALYRGLGEAEDYPMNYHVTGAIRLAHTKERMREFHHVASMARAQGLEMDICTPEELHARHPFMETHDLEGGLWDPLDGDIDPAQMTQAMAKGARRLGQAIHRFTPATGVSRQGHEWIVHTANGDIRCEKVVNAAGYYAQRVGEWFRPFGGRRVPMVVMSHQYFITEEIREIAQWSKEHGRKLPMVRDPDISYYLRQETSGLNLGPYERNCKAHWMTPDDPLPDDFSFQLYPDDLERLEYYIEDALARVPLLGSEGIGRVINGPIPYAPDGHPMIGPMPGVRDAFEAHSFTFGIAQAGGAGKVAAEWIVRGETEWDMWAVDPRRFTGHADDDFARQRGMEVYGHEYAIHFPRHEWPAGRHKKVSPIHEKLLDLGGQMGAYGGWERANWFAQPGDDVSEAATQTFDRNGPWEARVRGECEAVRDGVGVLDLPGFSRFHLSGSGARNWLEQRIAGRAPKPGRIALAYFCDERGHIVTEMSVIALAPDEFTLITAAPAEWHDHALLDDASNLGLRLTNETERISTLVVTGPQTRTLLEKIAQADLKLPWLTHQSASVANIPSRLVRVSYAGELGWEIHANTRDMPVLYDSVLAAGATPFGMYALDRLRLEKGFRAWKQDLSTDYSLAECGLERFARFDKAENFPGQVALAKEIERGPARRACLLTIDPAPCDPPPMSNVFLGGVRIGEITSSGFGYRVDSLVALAMVRADCAEPQQDVEVEVFGELHRARVHGLAPLWDPENARLRA
ncbi:MAG: FAD-dependent oxidoreductase [Pseudomonadota bacterium]